MAIRQQVVNFRSAKMWPTYGWRSNDIWNLERPLMSCWQRSVTGRNIALL